MRKQPILRLTRTGFRKIKACETWPLKEEMAWKLLLLENVMLETRRRILVEHLMGEWPCTSGIAHEVRRWGGDGSFRLFLKMGGMCLCPGYEVFSFMEKAGPLHCLYYLLCSIHFILEYVTLLFLVLVHFFLDGLFWYTGKFKILPILIESAPYDQKMNQSILLWSRRWHNWETRQETKMVKVFHSCPSLMETVVNLSFSKV